MISIMIDIAYLLPTHYNGHEFVQAIGNTVCISEDKKYKYLDPQAWWISYTELCTSTTYTDSFKFSTNALRKFGITRIDDKKLEKYCKKMKSAIEDYYIVNKTFIDSLTALKDKYDDELCLVLFGNCALRERNIIMGQLPYGLFDYTFLSCDVGFSTYNNSEIHDWMINHFTEKDVLVKIYSYHWSASGEFILCDNYKGKAGLPITRIHKELVSDTSAFIQSVEASMYIGY